MLMRIDVAREADREWWDGILGRSPSATIFQTTYWADYLRSYLHSDSYFVTCSDDGGEVLGALMLSRSGPLETVWAGRPLGSWMQAMGKCLRPLYSCHYGPVLVCPNELRAQVTELLIAQVRQIVGRGALHHLTLPHGTQDELRERWGSTFQARPWGTFMLDLQGAEEELWQHLRSSARKATRKAQEHGLTVETIRTEDQRREFYEFLREALRRRHARCHPMDGLLMRFNCLQPVDGEEIYVARHKGRIACSLGIWRYRGYLHEFGANQAQFSLDERLSAADLLKWEIIRREGAAEARCYDLCGVNPDPKTDKERGIYQFKKKWGGDYLEYSVYTSR
jgi:hypothetical protein